jgi:hypothetical protein
LGLGQTFAWIILRGGYQNAPGMIALSTFGPLMTIAGVQFVIRSLSDRSNAGNFNLSRGFATSARHTLQ